MSGGKLEYTPKVHRNMDEKFASFERLLTAKQHSCTDLELILVAIVCTLLTWYIQLLWSRRKLYESASKLSGPFALPIIGCALSFIGNPYTIFSNITKMFNNHPGIFRVWFGPRLFYCVSEPKYFEILLPACLRKEPLYKHASVIVGQGLFTAPETAMGVKVNAQTTDALYPKWADRIMEIVFLRIFVLWYHSDYFFNMLPIARDCENVVRNMHAFSGKVVREKKMAFEKKLRMRKESPDIYFEDGDFVIRAGTSVVFGILRAHTDEKYWPNPFKFDPDRFLPEEVAKRHPCAHVPFSHGPRNCIGPRYAMMAMKSLLSTVLRKYRIFTSYQKVEDVKLKANLVLRPKDGYKLALKNDENMKILHVNAKYPGSTHDSYIWNTSNVNEFLEQLYGRGFEGYFLLECPKKSITDRGYEATEEAYKLL
ncbi:hypothetical protein JTB14_016072 [Gonioctena quinquepunctata]|nr:hypothetical protein JTB14_016072 [Gonioctena quinquepunctata]